MSAGLPGLTAIAIRRVAGIVASLALGACALFPDGKTQDGAAGDKPGAESAAAPSPAASSAEANYRLEVDAPGPLKKFLLTYLDLARFQTAAQSESVTPDELVRLANAAPAQARSLLETEGYFSAQAAVERSVSDEGLPVISLAVTPGPRTTVGSVQVRTEGALATQAESGDPAAQRLRAQLTDRWTLPPGDPFRQADWTSAKNNALARLRAEGYPTAAMLDTEARIDARTQNAALTCQLQSGPLFLLGEMRIEGLSRYSERAVRNVAEFGVGTPYSEKLLLDYQDRLGKLGLFESVSVEIDTDVSAAGATPVTVKVREQRRQQATTGIGYSDKSGVRTTLEHRHRRPFGWDGQVYNKFEIGSLLRSWEGELISDPTPSRYRNLLATSLLHQRAAGEVTDSWRVRAGRSFDSERIERLIFGELLGSTLKNSVVDERAQALSLNYNWVWRDLDSVILPTKGLTTSIQAGGGTAWSNFGKSGPFMRFYARNTLYWPLGRDWHSQVRVEMGQIFASHSVGIPDALMFRAGGDESVRGYAYRTLGPLKNGALASGRTLLTTSAEIAHPISAKLPSLWWAAFVDAGNAANNAGELDPALGYGLGLRIRSPVGPLRIDVAHGEKIHKTRLHLSVGIAF
jgi:translocation and assembly module TamA